MRLLIFSSEFPPGPGGIGTHAYELARQLHDRGWDLAVLTSQDYTSRHAAAAFNQTQPFSIHRLKALTGAPFKAIYRGWRLARLGRQWRPDLLLATGGRAVWLAALPLHRLPWVAIGHGTEFGDPESWAGRWTRRAFERATAVVCVSEYTRRFMRERSHIRARWEHVIPNGADASRFRVLPDVVTHRRRLGIEDRARVLLTVGHVSQRKGQEVVIRALPRIVERFPDVLYLIVGYPTEKPALQSLARRLGVSGHVRFTGVVDSELLPTYMNCCDVFVMASRLTNDGDFEGYGIAVVEAALCGKPAVVSRDSGLTEAIVEGETGLSAPQDDADATADVILSLLESDAVRRKMGEAAHQRALREQTWSHRGQEYDRFLRQVLGSCSPAEPES